MSSLKKGESIEDTIRVVAGYADLIVMRHDLPGSAERAAAVCDVPFINAGDGSNEHPTQALVDVYTIWKEKGTLEGLHVAMGLDPLQSRAIHSLTLLLSQYRGVPFTFISPPALRLPAYLAQHLRERLIPFEETDDLSRGLTADVFYVNRLQEERFADREVFEHWRSRLTLRRAMVEGQPCLILDPLPHSTRSLPTSMTCHRRRTSARRTRGCRCAWRCWRRCSGGPSNRSRTASPVRRRRNPRVGLCRRRSCG